MKLVLFYIFAVFMTGCSVAPERLNSLSVEQCVLYGVAVTGEITGQVITSEFAFYGQIRKACQGEAQGCTVGASGDFPDPAHEYSIYYADHKCLPEHEACHALYETSAHTYAFMARVYQGDKFAACPQEDTYVFRVHKTNLLKYHPYKGRN